MDETVKFRYNDVINLLLNTQHGFPILGNKDCHVYIIELSTCRKVSDVGFKSAAIDNKMLGIEYAPWIKYMVFSSFVFLCCIITGTCVLSIYPNYSVLLHWCWVNNLENSYSIFNSHKFNKSAHCLHIKYHLSNDVTHICPPSSGIYILILITWM